MLAQTRPGWVDQLDEWHLLTATKIAVVIGLAVLASWLARKGIRRAVRGMSSLRSTIGGQPSPRSDQRARTVTAVLRSVAGAVIWTVAVIAILSMLGVNIAAFVTVSSIVGAALAFGAQQIIRDLLAGFFMFTEDQYGVGDSVDLGLAEGTVEEVSLRVTRLRDIEGKVWYVPHGQITRVANLSQEWTQAVVDVPVPRDADLRAATEAVASVAADLEDDPSIGPELLDHPEVLGVQELLDDRVVLRVVARTTPSARLAVARALRARIADAVRDGVIPAPAAPAPTPVRIVTAPSPPAPPALES